MSWRSPTTPISASAMKRAIRESLFARLCDRHPKLLAVKLDGATKEMFVWGLRVGFITYGTRVSGDVPAFYDALERKTAGNIRGTVSNASHLSQSIVRKALQTPDDLRRAGGKDRHPQGRAAGSRRPSTIRNTPTPGRSIPSTPATSCVWVSRPWKPNPSGFTCWTRCRVGLIATGPHDIRIAFSSVDEENIPDLFDSLFRAIQDIQGG